MKLQQTNKQNLLKEKNYMIMPYWFCGLDPNEAIILSYLIDQEDFQSKKDNIKKGGYFLCCVSGYMTNRFFDPTRSTDENEKELNKQCTRIRTALKKLEERGFITKKVYNRTKTYIKINRDKLDEFKSEYNKVRQDMIETLKNNDFEEFYDDVDEYEEERY